LRSRSRWRAIARHPLLQQLVDLGMRATGAGGRPASETAWGGRWCCRVGQTSAVGRDDFVDLAAEPLPQMKAVAGLDNCRGGGGDCPAVDRRAVAAHRAWSSASASPDTRDGRSCCQAITGVALAAFAIGGPYPAPPRRPPQPHRSPHHHLSSRLVPPARGFPQRTTRSWTPQSGVGVGEHTGSPRGNLCADTMGL
jgi:hypothetical protein